MASTSTTVTVANGSGSVALSQFRSVYLSLDHAALVTAKRSRSDGADLYITYAAASSADGRRAVFVENANTTTARVWFSLAVGIAASASDTGYTLHWGDLTASLPTIAAETYSQVISGSYHIDGNRTQPFAWFDDFKYSKAGGSGWAAITGGDALDSTRYGTNGTWQYVTGGAVSVAYGSADRYFKATTDESRTTQRVRANVTLGSGATGGLRAGVLIASDTGTSGSADLDGYGGGLRYVDGSSGSLIRWDDGTETNLSTAAISPVRVDLETTIEITQNASSSAQEASVASDTYTLTSSDSDHSGASWGIYADTPTGTGTFYVWRVMAMVWDGVTDSDITVSGTVPALSLPDCSAGFPVTETIAYPQALNPFPDFQSPRSQPAVVDGYGERFDVGSFDVQWAFLTPTDYFEIIAFYEAKKGSSFSWTPPGGSARTVRIRPGSLTTTQEAPQKFSAAVSLDKVPL